MGTARKTARMPLKNIPSFTRAVRLEIPLSTFIEVLLEPTSSMPLHKAGPGTALVGPKARRRCQKHLGPTWLGPRHHRANPARPVPVGLRSQPFEVVGRLLMRGRNHPQSSWPYSLHGRQPRDRRSNMSDTRRRHVSDLRVTVA